MYVLANTKHTWLMDHVMHPSLALLDPQVPPLGLRHQVGLGYTFCDVFGQHYMSAKLYNVTINWTPVQFVLGGHATVTQHEANKCQS